MKVGLYENYYKIINLHVHSKDIKKAISLLIKEKFTNTYRKKV